MGLVFRMVFTKYSIVKSKILQSKHKILNGDDGCLISLLMDGLYGVKESNDKSLRFFDYRCGFRESLFVPLNKLISTVIGGFSMRHARTRNKRIRFFSRSRTERIVVSQKFGKTFKLKIRGTKLFSKISGRLNFNYMPKAIPKHN